MTPRLTTALLLMLLAQTPAAQAKNLFRPDPRVLADDYTVLMAADARLSAGLTTEAGDHRKFDVTGWTRPEDSFVWEVDVPYTDDYAANFLFDHRAGATVNMILTCGTSRADLVSQYRAVPDHYRWRRQSARGSLRLPAGKQTLTLRAVEPGGGKFKLALWSVELVRPAVRDRLARTAVKLRADTRPLVKLRYGFMVHWTPESWPRRGGQKTYADAVRDFDVERFANQVQEGGAGFLVFVTAHTYQYFPAPIRALERILPGRTTERDLVVELAAALARRNIELYIYYHLGSDTDTDWLKASSFWDPDTRTFFGHWVNIISEIGKRYGRQVTGFWFDDGINNYYYRSAPWERLYRAAKAGNPSRVVTFNRWIWPSPTEFQDYDACEACDDPSANGWLPVGGNGKYTDGPAAGLQACSTLISEKSWVHTRKDTDIGPPRWSPGQLARYIRDFESRKSVPIFNLEIYQEGTVSNGTIDTFRRARTMMEQRQGANP